MAITHRGGQRCDHVAIPVAKDSSLIGLDFLLTSKADIVTPFWPLWSLHRWGPSGSEFFRTIAAVHKRKASDLYRSSACVEDAIIGCDRHE